MGTRQTFLLGLGLPHFVQTFFILFLFLCFPSFASDDKWFSIDFNVFFSFSLCLHILLSLPPFLPFLCSSICRSSDTFILLNFFLLNPLSCVLWEQKTWEIMINRNRFFGERISSDRKFFFLPPSDWKIRQAVSRWRTGNCDRPQRKRFDWTFRVRVPAVTNLFLLFY